MTLHHFKGVKRLDIDFTDVTTISGRNATGKTTLFDAFTWLLFGKNSDDKKQFSIKTLDSDGNVIPKLPHSVSADLVVDGETIALKRTLTEKWQKRRGSSEEEFRGNEEERLYNDVPLSVKDWSAKIASILDEETFKVLTSPLYFCSMGWKEQRQMLIDMVGDISDEEVVTHNPEGFSELLAQLSGKTLEEYRKEIAAKKRRAKDDIDTLPARIEERRSVIADNDTGMSVLELEQTICIKNDGVKHLDEKIKNASTAVKVDDRLVKMSSGISKVMADISELESSLRGELVKQNNQLRQDAEAATSAINYNQLRLNSFDIELSRLNNKLNTAKAERESLLTEWRAIKAEALTFADGDFTCPCCHRPLEPSQIEEKQAQMTEEFNKSKADRLARNKERGLECKQLIESVTESIETFAKQREKAVSEIEKAQKALDVLQKPLTDEEINSKLGEHEGLNKVKELLKQRQEEKARLEAECADEAAGGNSIINELLDERNKAQAELDALRSQLALKKVAETNKKRITELEAELKAKNEELAKLEQIEFTIMEFTHTRIDLLQNKINSMFSIVKFKMYDTQINGGEVETCKAVIDGVPYEDLNHAAKINGGLDIIRTFCKRLGVTAPIFIDNAEAVNNLIDIDSQTIRLVVSEDETLTVS